MDEVSSPRYPHMRVPPEVTNIDSLLLADKGLHRSVSDVVAALKNDMLTPEIENEIFTAMSPSTQRSVVSRIAGLDASVLMTFKQMLGFVDAVLRKIVAPDGTRLAGGESLDVSVKDAMNMSIKVTQVLTRDLPKVYTLDRIQKQERALHTFMERHMNREQQTQYLDYLHKIEKELEDE